MRLESRLWLSAYLVLTSACWGVARLPAGWRGVGYLALQIAITLLFWRLWRLARTETGAFHSAVLSVGIVARLCLVGVASFTSHDSFRYLWDGHIAELGLDPYRISPRAVSDGWAGALPDNAAYPTLYPPLAIFLFRLLATLGPEVGLLVWRMWVALASISTLWLTYRFLERRGQLAALPIAALFPLSVFEAGLGGHLDVLMTTALLAAVFLAPKQKLASGVALGVAILLKLVPVLAVPVLFIRREARVIAVVAILTVTAGYALAYGVGWRPVGSLGVFLREWSFGSPLSQVVRSRPVLVGLALVAMACLAWTSHRSGDVWAVLPGLLFVLFLTSPVVFPWYLIPLAALTAVYRSSTLLVWMSVLPVTYEVIDRFDREAVWAPAAWPLFVLGAAQLFVVLKGLFAFCVRRVRGIERVQFS